MKVTNMINKIFNDFENVTLAINSSLKYRFMYNGFQTDVFFTPINGLQNQLLIAITVNGVDYLSTLFFSQNNSP